MLDPKNVNNNLTPHSLKRIEFPQKNETQKSFSLFHSNKIESPISENNPYFLKNLTPSPNGNIFFSPEKNSNHCLDLSLQKKKNYTEFYENGSKYEGEKQNGVRNGNGKFIFTSGAYYEGQWKNNKKNGKGLLINSEGKKIYEGEWMNDKYHGKGVLYNQNITYTNEEFEYEDFDYLNGKWIKFEGLFADDEKCGKGIFYLSNGERFYGNFEHDFLNGSGTFYRNNGDVINGTWNKNKFIEE